MDMGNRFSVLKECMAPSTPASKRKDGTVMASWENPIMNAAQYSNYGFNKENVKPKKVKAPGLNPVNKRNDPKEALSSGRHVKGSGPAGDHYNSSPQLNASNVELTSVDPVRTSKVTILKRSSGKEAGPGDLRQENNYLGLQETRPLIHQRVDGVNVMSKYAEKTQKGDDRSPRAQSTLYKVEEAPTQNKVRRSKVPGSKKIKDNAKFPEHWEMIVPIKVETLDSSKTRSIRRLIDTGCTDFCVDEKWVKEENFELQKLDVPRRAHNADGTPNITGDITHYIELRMTIGPHTNKQRFFVSNLGKAKMFIGYDWIRDHNSVIDWQKYKIVFN
jgi:hypothetical protein